MQMICIKNLGNANEACKLTATKERGICGDITRVALKVISDHRLTFFFFNEEVGHVLFRIHFLSGAYLDREKMGGWMLMRAAG